MRSHIRSLSCHRALPRYAETKHLVELPFFEHVVCPLAELLGIDRVVQKCEVFKILD